RSRGRSAHGACSCAECGLPAHMRGWGAHWEEDGGTQGQRWVVTRDAAWRGEPDDGTRAVLQRPLVSILHPNREKRTASDAKLAWVNLIPCTWDLRLHKEDTYGSR